MLFTAINLISKIFIQNGSKCLLFINSIYQGHAVYSFTKKNCDLLYMRATKFLDFFFIKLHLILESD